MTTAMSNGTFFERYKPYFRFSARPRWREQRSGMLFDRLPAPLRPFTGQVFTSRGQKLMNALRVPQTLGAENRKLVAGVAAAARGAARPRRVPAGRAVRRSTPCSAWARRWRTSGSPPSSSGWGSSSSRSRWRCRGSGTRIERAAAGARRPRADGRLPARLPARAGAAAGDRLVQPERKLPSQYVFRETAATPQEGWDEAGPSAAREHCSRARTRSAPAEPLPARGQDPPGCARLRHAHHLAQPAGLRRLGSPDAARSSTTCGRSSRT